MAVTKNNNTDTQADTATFTVTAKTEGFRRAGREWQGTTEITAAEFTDEQWAQLTNEPKLHVVRTA